jgi:hypothetical protein
MAIITVSRGSLAGGERLAALLGERLGSWVVSRSVPDLDAEARDGRVRLIGRGGEQLARWAVEQVRRLPGVLAVDTSAASPGANVPS